MSDYEIIDEDVAPAFATAERILPDEERGKLMAYLSSEVEAVLAGEDRAAFLESLKLWRRQRISKPEFAVKNYPWDNASNVVPPELEQKGNTIWAKIINGLLALSPLWTIEPTDPALAQHCRALEQFLDYLAKSPTHLNLVEDLRDPLYDLVTLGTGIVRMPWLLEQSQVKTIINGAVTAFLQTKKNGPALRHVQVENLLTRSHWKDYKSSPWLGILHRMTSLDIKQRVRSGLFSSNVLNEDGEVAMSTATFDDGLQAQYSSAGLDPNTERRGPADGLYDIIEAWVWWDVDGQGILDELKVWFERDSRRILRLEYNSLGDREVRLGTYFSLPDLLYGRGIMSIGSSMQDVIEALTNMRINSLHLAMFPMFKGRAGSGLGKNEELRPMKLFMLDGSDDLLPTEIPYNGDSTLLSETRASQYMAKATGVNDPMSGVSDPVLKSGGGAQANEFLAEQTSSILSAVQQNIRNFLGDIGRLLFYQLVANATLTEQFLGVLDAEQQRLLRELFAMPREDLPLRLRFQVKLTDLETNDAKEAQKMVLYNGMYQQYGQAMINYLGLAAQPQVPPPVKQMALQMAVGSTKFIAEAFEKFKLPGASRYLPSMDLEEALLEGQDLQKKAMAAEAEAKIKEVQSAMDSSPGATIRQAGGGLAGPEPGPGEGGQRMAQSGDMDSASMPGASVEPGAQPGGPEQSSGMF